MLKRSCWSRSSNGGFPVQFDGDQLNDDSICTETDVFSYDWPGLDNLEDVDDLFKSSYDSSFGLDIDDNDPFGWFPSSTFDLPTCDKPDLDVVKSEVDALPTVSKQAQSLSSSHDGSIGSPQSSENKKKRKLDQCSFSRNIEKAESDLLCVEKSVSCVENEGEGQSEVRCNDIGSTKQDSSCISSVVDEISTDTTSLKQLQDVMLQLDKRTKLCIRDSLYRLARSASQRHNSDDKDATGGLLSDGINKCNGLIDIETDTNPIDRSIAHLLFHRPEVK